MRLGQLARKLALRPVEIIDFLAQHHISIDPGGNTRVEDEHVALIIREFAPELSEEKIVEAISEGNEGEPSQTNTNTVPPEEIVSSELQTDVPREEKIELIKAPKVELSGLRVLGKIELPEIKKKEIPPVETSENQPSSIPERRRPSPQRRERSSSSSDRNPIAIQREKEAREAEERRKAEIEREKEKRALHYRKKVKAAPPSKRVRMVDEPVEEFSAEQLVEAPKTWIGKFLRWLNT